MTEKTKW